MKGGVRRVHGCSVSIGLVRFLTVESQFPIVESQSQPPHMEEYLSITLLTFQLLKVYLR